MIKFLKTLFGKTLPQPPRQSRMVTHEDITPKPIQYMYEIIPPNLFRVTKTRDKVSGKIAYTLLVRPDSSPHDYKSELFQSRNTSGIHRDRSEPYTVEGNLYIHRIRWNTILDAIGNYDSETTLTRNGYTYKETYTNLAEIKIAMKMYVNLLALQRKGEFSVTEIDIDSF
jgi:hypothetical protein